MPRKAIVFCGPRGVGKGTLVHAISEHFSIPRYVSCTTRPMRHGEVDGVHYHFLDQDRFSMLSASGYLLWTIPIGQYGYGMRKKEIQRLEVGVTDVYPDGARKMRTLLRQNGGDALLVSVTASSAVRFSRVRARNDIDVLQVQKLLREDPVSDDPADYADFDRFICNDTSDRYLAVQQALEITRQFLQKE